MSGYINDLSPEQKTALTTLRDKISDVITPRCDDVYLLRFLRSRSFDLDKSEKKIRATLEFRKKYGADTILEDWTPPPVLEKYFVGGSLPGLDKSGHPIIVLALGNFDLKGIMKSCSREEIIKYKVLAMERTEQRMKECGVDKVTFVADLHGLSSYHLYRPSLQLFSYFMQIEEMHYPEFVNKGFLVRAPRIFPTIFALVKPFIDPNTREKLEVCGSNYKEKLKEYLPSSIIPEILGGELKDHNKICWGGRVPKEMFKENDDSLQHQYVKPGKSFTIEVQVEKPGTELAWEFVTENHDISFSVSRLDGSQKVEVVATERIAAHLGNVDGSISCELSGVYVLEWDNSFSWTKGKNLKYRYDVVDPESSKLQQTE